MALNVHIQNYATLTNLTQYAMSVVKISVWDWPLHNHGHEVSASDIQKFPNDGVFHAEVIDPNLRFVDEL